MEILELELDDKGKHTLEMRMSRLKKKLHAVGSAEPAMAIFRGVCLGGFAFL
jgi:hypothetical protein